MQYLVSSLYTWVYANLCLSQAGITASRARLWHNSIQHKTMFNKTVCACFLDVIACFIKMFRLFVKFGSRTHRCAIGPPWLYAIGAGACYPLFIPPWTWYRSSPDTLSATAPVKYGVVRSARRMTTADWGLMLWSGAVCQTDETMVVDVQFWAGTFTCQKKYGLHVHM